MGRGRHIAALLRLVKTHRAHLLDGARSDTLAGNPSECASSPLGLVALDRASALHHVPEHALLLDVLAPARSEVALSCGSILRDRLGAETRARVVRLVLVKVFLGRFARRRLWQSPAWHVLLSGRVGGVLGGVAAGTNRCWCAGVVLEAALAATVAKGVFCGFPELGFALGIVLGAWVLLQVVWLHLYKEMDAITYLVSYRFL